MEGGKGGTASLDCPNYLERTGTEESRLGAILANEFLTSINL